MANKLKEIFVKNGGDIRVNTEGDVYVEGEDGLDLVMKPSVSFGVPSRTINSSLLEALTEQTSTSEYNSIFKIKANGDLEWKTEPHNIVELTAEETIDRELLLTTTAADLDQHIKTQLAQKIAQRMIEEDLIDIYSEIDINSNTQQIKAKVKFVQE